MKQKFKNLFGYFLAFLFLIALIFLYSEYKALSTEIGSSEESRINHSFPEHKAEIDLIDSLIQTGSYKKADSLAKDFNIKEVGNDGDLVLRLKILNEIVNLKNQNQTLLSRQNSLRKSEDSLIFKKDSIIENLKLELANSKVDLYYTSQQIEDLNEENSKNSLGKYLTFATTKGKELHYIGEVKKGMANGYGIAILETGSRYVGEWKDNMRHGNGEFTWNDGESYKGNYVNDLREGYGVYIFDDGQRYVGQWKKDMRDGLGKFYNENGKLVAEGLWEKDELVEENADN